VVDPAIVALPRQDPGGGFTARADVAVRNTGKETTTVTPRASMPGVRVSTEPVRMRLPAGQTEALTVIASAAGRGRPPGYLAGTLRLGPATARLALPVEPPPAAPMSPLALLTDAGRTSGVRFSAGAVRTAGTARDVEPIGDLRLEVIDAGGSVVRELTPQGGARDLLPGEYAYTLTKDAMNALKAGPFRFRATAHGPAGGRATVRTSPSFETK
jgi:hypothetical protein